MIIWSCFLVGLVIGTLTLVTVEPITAWVNPGASRVLTTTVLIGLPAGYLMARLGPPLGRWERAVITGLGAWISTLLLPLGLQHRLVIAIPYLWFLPTFAFGGAFACLDGNSLPSHGMNRPTNPPKSNSNGMDLETPRVVIRRPGVLLVLAILAGWCSLPLWRTLRTSSHRVECERHLKRIFQALQAYRQEWGGQYPLVLTHRVPASDSSSSRITGLYPKYITNPQVFLCPDDPYRGRLLANSQREIPLSYDYHRPRAGQGKREEVFVECVGDHPCSQKPWETCRLRLLQNGQIVEAPLPAQ